MRPIPATKGAEIVDFRQASRAANIFTARDRLDVLSWEAGSRGDIRLAIHKRHDSDPPEVGEFVSIYPANACWAAWGAARQGRKIALWRARDGRELGQFETMGEVLALVTGSAQAGCRLPG